MMLTLTCSAISFVGGWFARVMYDRVIVRRAAADELFCLEAERRNRGFPWKTDSSPMGRL